MGIQTVVVLNDGETWSSIKDCQVIPLAYVDANGFEVSETDPISIEEILDFWNQHHLPLSEQINQKVQAWLYSEDEHYPKSFNLGDRQFELEYTGDRYLLWEDGGVIGWNDNHKDFRTIGDWLFKETA